MASELVTRVGFKPTLIARAPADRRRPDLVFPVSPDSEYLTDILPASLLAAAGLGFAFVPMMIAAVSGVSGATPGWQAG